MTISSTNRHFSLVDARSRSQLHMAGAFITFSDCVVSFLFLFQKTSSKVLNVAMFATSLVKVGLCLKKKYAHVFL